MKKVTLVVTMALVLTVFSAPSVQAALLFGDSFDRPNSTDLNASTDGKTGLLGALNWGSGTLQSLIDINGNALRTNNNDSDGNDGAWAWVEHNFVGLTEFTVTVDISQSSGGNGRFAGFRVGQALADISGETDSAIGGKAADVAVYYDNIGTTKGMRIYEGSADQGYFAFPNAAGAPDTVSARFTFANMNAGTALGYEVFFNGDSVMSDATAWSGTNENTISLQSNSTNNTLFDNFQVTAPVPSVPLTLTTNTGTGGLSGQVTHDATFGYGGTQFHVKNSGNQGSTTRKGYIRFDTSAITDTVVEASLDLTVSLIDAAIGDSDQTIYVYGLTDETQDSWNPAAMTWANAPGNDTESAYLADLSEAVLLGTFQLDYNGDKAAPVGTVVGLSNQAIIEFLNADTNGLVTLFLGRTGTNGNKNLLFAGDTHGSLAEPTLNLSVVPEPATLALTAVGLLGLRRRRR